uniref:Uncharacterized protein n=1 Tax=Candidatus Methanophaga sp. ANME-1 ERB7 TaxID=2759913 RepID=A0A7G9ZAA5_9EURY|nr:hypothetical protein HJKONFEM_00039 [Methanosarcinales archaeon ANME-1 ERB7]
MDKNVIIIEGIPGIGKSYIAAKFADELKDEYTIYWYGNLSEVSTLSSVMNKISIFLKENGKPKLSNSIEHFGYDNEVLIALLKEELNANNFALFFDDYHKAEKELNPLLKQLVSITSSKIIIVTRVEPEFYNVVDERENRVTKIKVDAWDFANTKMMLEVRGIEATDGTIEEIHDRLLGHPQYLNLFCILAEGSSAENLLESLPIVLKDAHKYLEKEVYNLLTAEEKRLLQTIAVFRLPETVDAFDNVNKFEFKDLNETLNSLIHKFLVNEIGINTYSVHEIIRDYSLNDVRSKKILRSYHELAAEYYLSLGNDPEHVLEASYHFDKAGMKEEAAKVIINNAGDLIAQGFWEKIEDRLQSAIKSFRRKTQSNIIQLVARANLEIGRLYAEKGDYDLALRHATKCLMPFNKIHDTSDIYDLDTLLGSIYFYKNENANAKEYNEKCLHMAEKQKDEYWKAVAIANRGTYTEDVNEELDYYLKSLKIFENENADINIADVCTNIATVYAKMKNYEKSYEFIKRALKRRKERNAFYDIAQIKEKMADIYYRDPEKPVSVDSIITCLKEALETFEKIGHVRGTARVLTKIGDIYRKEKDFKSALANYQEAATIYSSLNQQSEEAKLNAIIGLCYVKLKDFSHAKSYLEKNLLSGHCDIVDKLSLAEIYLNIGDYNEAFDLSNKLITDDTEEISDDKRYVALLFSSISSVLLNNVDDAYNYLKKIGEFDSQKYNMNWDFSDIKPVLDKTGESKQFFIDAIALLKGDANYPIVRLKDVKLLSEEAEKQAEVFHPFTGSFTITKEDENLKEIMQKLRPGEKIDSDTPEIMGMKRDKALLIFGFLFMKGFLDCKNPAEQMFDLKLSEKGLKVLGLSGSS